MPRETKMNLDKDAEKSLFEKVMKIRKKASKCSPDIGS
jgi:hypothetical protein